MQFEETFAILGFYAAQIGSLFPTFRDKLSVPSSRVKQSKKKFFFDCLPLKTFETSSFASDSLFARLRF
jgi:hypothetical protein